MVGALLRIVGPRGIDAWRRGALVVRGSLSNEIGVTSFRRLALRRALDLRAPLHDARHVPRVGEVVREGREPVTHLLVVAVLAPQLGFAPERVVTKRRRRELAIETMERFTCFLSIAELFFV